MIFGTKGLAEFLPKKKSLNNVQALNFCATLGIIRQERLHQRDKRLRKYHNQRKNWGR